MASRARSSCPALPAHTHCDASSSRSSGSSCRSSRPTCSASSDVVRLGRSMTSRLLKCQNMVFKLQHDCVVFLSRKIKWAIHARQSRTRTAIGSCMKPPRGKRTLGSKSHVQALGTGFDRLLTVPRRHGLSPVAVPQHSNPPRCAVRRAANQRRESPPPPPACQTCHCLAGKYIRHVSLLREPA